MVKHFPTTKLRLGEEEKGVMVNLKEISMKPAIHAPQREDAPFSIDTDVRDKEVVCVLLRPQQDARNLRPIAYRIWKLYNAEENHDTAQQKYLAVIWAVLIVRTSIEGSRHLRRIDN